MIYLFLYKDFTLRWHTSSDNVCVIEAGLTMNVLIDYENENLVSSCYQNAYLGVLFIFSANHMVGMLQCDSIAIKLDVNRNTFYVLEMFACTDKKRGNVLHL